MMKRKALVILTVVAAVALTGCGQTSKLAQDSALTPTPKPVPKIIPAIVPGSIVSVVQKNLTSKCKDSVDPVRVIMAKYKSGFAMSPAQTNEIIKLNKVVLTACTFPVYKKWYEKEFMGWFYAKN
jgi:ABC-type Fe3+-hydroxamate transport system substrate-binding protein